MLTLRNDGARAATLTFATTQRYDIEIRDAGRWSSGMMFGEMLGEERIGAGDRLVFTEQCRAPGHPGWYEVVGRIPAADRVIEARTRLRVRP